jgi:hypothetical protein
MTTTKAYMLASEGVIRHWTTSKALSAFNGICQVLFPEGHTRNFNVKFKNNEHEWNANP